VTRLKVRRITQFLYTGYCMVAFLVLGLTVVVIDSFLPDIKRRRRVARVFARLFLRVIGVPLSIEGRQLLPRTPCVVVANHASYIDGIIAVAALPADFAFVIKKEMVKVPLAGFLLRRLGSEFVERFDRHKGATDARRVLRLAATGQSLVFFPEGTFDHVPRIGKFLAGAFAIAARSSMPIVAVAIHGTREMFPPAGAFFHRVPIRFQILEVMPPDGARERSRRLIAEAVGDPLEPPGQSA
jgi:1-acyl-sn-glycerol-3-phosphate acyltransferase